MSETHAECVRVERSGLSVLTLWDRGEGTSCVTACWGREPEFLN